MMTDTDVSNPDVNTPATGAVTSLARAGQRATRKRRGWSRAVLAAMVIATLGFNGWWYWRETRPVVDLKTIATWLRTERTADAEMALRELLRRSPNNDEARIMLARAVGARGDHLGCARLLHEIPVWSTLKHEARFHEGNTFLMIDRARDAELAWRDIVFFNPLHPAPPKLFHDAGALLLELYAIEDRWDDAFVVIWKAFDEAAPSDRPTLLSWRIRSELERMAYSESIKTLRRYVAADPLDWDGLHALAKAEVGVGLQEDAERHYTACLKGQPENPSVWRDYLTMLYERGDEAKWLAALSRVPKAVEVEPEIWKFRGIVKEKAGDLAGAADDYRKAIERNPNIVEYHYRLAMSEERLGKHDQAVEHRKTTQRIREARADLRVAFADFIQAEESDIAKQNSAIERLVTICRTLGYTRAADEWARLIKDPNEFK
jgi:tetratricopeptide (TPR) repeat protein